jgi:tetraacyldisaccharide 4'-kinase
VAEATLLHRVWFDDDALARAARLALLPLAEGYRAIVGARAFMYDRGLLVVHETAIPSVSVGNLSVGGTGKTPVSAWLAGELAGRGARPAIVLRGYGDDEPKVHRVLNPAVPVIVASDRVAGVVRARAAGADVAVLDDAFQHRRARRVADLVLMSADRFSPTLRLLPAGPLREPLGALRRAALIVVTRKAADRGAADTVAEEIARIAPSVPRMGVHLAPGALIEVEGTRRLPLEALAGKEVRALLAIGDPAAFLRQIGALAGRISAEVHSDHHQFTQAEVASFARSVPTGAIAICTLKDAVKLAVRWPRAAPPLWYVSQHVIVERGGEFVDRIIDELMRTRGPSPRNAG